MTKTIFMIGKDSISNPTSASDFQNDFCYLIKNNKKARVLCMDRVVVVNDVVFASSNGGIKIQAPPEKSIFLLHLPIPEEVVLMDYDYIVDTFTLSKKICSDRFETSFLLNKKGISVPEYAFNHQLDPPLMIKDRTKRSVDNKEYVIDEKGIDAAIRHVKYPYFAQKYIGADKEYQASFRVYLYLYNVLCTNLRFNPEPDSFTLKYNKFIEVPLSTITSPDKITYPYWDEDITSYTFNSRYASPDIWRVLTKKELETLHDVYIQEDMQYKADLSLSALPYTVEKVAIEAAKALKIGLCMIDIVQDSNGYPYVVDISADFSKELLSKRLGYDNDLYLLAYSMLQDSDLFNDA